MEAYTNSIGMRFVRIEAGEFIMGSSQGGDFDERPAHPVTISRPFLMAATAVTNAQYERFDLGHRRYRGERGLSAGDDEAVVFVRWYDASRFCAWLSRKEGRPCRLPSEAEWEYACRAGTTGDYWTGASLPESEYRHQEFAWDPSPVSLKVGQTPPNPWGLHDMHGLVEEWCADWYGPYEPFPRSDPVGRVVGEMKVARGGSHNALPGYLRSANRLGAPPRDKHWLIGFRVVMGEAPKTRPLPRPDLPLWASGVRQGKHTWPAPLETPAFEGPQRYIHIPPGSEGPLYSQHNHCPSLIACPNGDLLAVWFSTRTERGREMTIAASRLRQDSKEWDPASEFFKAPDRNMTGSALWHDGEGILYHFNGLEAGHGWANLALVMRTSRDNGVTWRTRLIDPNHRPHNQVIPGALRTREGFLIQPCDAVYGGNGGTAVHISRDGGKTWRDPGQGKPAPDFGDGKSGAWIAGIHAGVVQLNDGSLMAFGRGDTIGGRMPRSLSRDMGRTWTYSPTPYPPIGGGQRLVLMRLQEGPILFISFTDMRPEDTDSLHGLIGRDLTGQERRIYGMYAALSFDEGATWPILRPVSPGRTGKAYDGGGWTGSFALDASHAEPKGYLAATQTPDGMIHLVSSALYYRFNLAWLKDPLPEE
ncbi:MAG: SUMF1/EgtB/PvdO family nonheme iron enzyme [Armatimonadetes bacterium]|nr:SUMF1/EgtB/PvdO family nonheme iron enzyme [Armatimonadota bacterium]